MKSTMNMWIHECCDPTPTVVNEGIREIHECKLWETCKFGWYPKVSFWDNSYRFLPPIHYDNLVEDPQKVELEKVACKLRFAFNRHRIALAISEPKASVDTEWRAALLRRSSKLLQSCELLHQKSILQNTEIV